MGSIPTSTQSVPIIPHKLAPKLSCFFIRKLVKKYGKKTIYTDGAFGTLMHQVGRGRACVI